MVKKLVVPRLDRIIFTCDTFCRKKYLTYLIIHRVRIQLRESVTVLRLRFLRSDGLLLAR